MLLALGTYLHTTSSSSTLSGTDTQPLLHEPQSLARTDRLDQHGLLTMDAEEILRHRLKSRETVFIQASIKRVAAKFTALAATVVKDGQGADVQEVANNATRELQLCAVRRRTRVSTFAAPIYFPLQHHIPPHNPSPPNILPPATSSRWTKPRWWLRRATASSLSILT